MQPDTFAPLFPYTHTETEKRRGKSTCAPSTPPPTDASAGQQHKGFILYVEKAWFQSQLCCGTNRPPPATHTHTKHARTHMRSVGVGASGDKGAGDPID